MTTRSIASVAPRLLAALLAATLPWSVGGAPPAAARDTRCSMAVQATRVKTASDVPFERVRPGLGEPQNPDSVAGPDSSVLVVRREKNISHVVLRARGSGADTLFGGRAAAPNWSPDGTRISAAVWESWERPGILAILTRATGAVCRVDLRMNVLHYKWSPDSKWIAAHGQSWDTHRPVLAWIRAADGHGAVLDTIPAFAECDFSWTPSSKRLAAVIPTVAFDDDDFCESELWVYSDSGRERCQVTNTLGDAEDDPQWISERALLLNVHRCRGKVPGPDSVRVMEFSGR